MAFAMQSMVAAAYVADVGDSLAFYRALGFDEHSRGENERAAWVVLAQREARILLVSTHPPADLPRFPLLFYFYVDDLGSLTGALAEASIPFTETGHPPHAEGGEVRLLDPDGNTLLAGQRQRSASQPPPPPGDATVRFSLLQEAAALVEASGGTTAACHVDVVGGQCGSRADVKIADTAGDTVWACLRHADEILVTVPGAFVTSQGEAGLARFRSRQRGQHAG